MDGKGCWIDNRFIERLWRSVKYEDIYLNDYLDGLEPDLGWEDGSEYNTFRPHQALGNPTPADWYHWPESYAARTADWDRYHFQKENIQ